MVEASLSLGRIHAKKRGIMPLILFCNISALDKIQLMHLEHNYPTQQASDGIGIGVIPALSGATRFFRPEQIPPIGIFAYPG
jgi:hypothetical protein